MKESSENTTFRPERRVRFFTLKNILVFVLVVAACALLLYSSALFIVTSNKVMEERSFNQAFDELISTLTTTWPAVGLAMEADLNDAEVMKALGQPDSGSNAILDIFQPFIFNNDSGVVQESNLPTYLVRDIENRFSTGKYISHNLTSYDTPAYICRVYSNSQTWLVGAVEIPGTDRSFGLARNITNVISGTQKVQQTFIGTFILAFLISLIILFVVLRVITTPLKSLTDSAIQYARGDFSNKVVIPSGITELEILADTFNQMGSDLKDQRDSLSANSRKLEEANRKAEDALRQVSRRNTEQKAMINTSLEANRLGLPEEVIGLVLASLCNSLDLISTAYYLPLKNGDFKPECYPDHTLIDENVATGEVFDAIIHCLQNMEAYRIPGVNSGLYGDQLYIPLSNGLNKIGVLRLITDSGANFDDDMIRFCSYFTNHIEVILRNKALYQETIRRSQELERINQISRSISGELDMDPLIRDVVENTSNTIHAECTFLGLMNGNRLMIHHITPGSAQLDDWVINVEEHEYLSDLITKGSSLLVSDLDDDERIGRDGFIKANGFKSLIATPIMRKNEVLGVICGFSRRLSAFVSSDAYFLELLASQVAIALDNAHLFEQILTRDKRRDHQLMMAQKLQKNRVPVFFKQSIAAVSCKLQAADELAGDFCDVFSLGRYSIALVIGDVANKGIAASLMTFSLLSMFRDVAKNLKPPCEVLETINRSLIAQIKEDGWFATSFYGRLNTKLGTLTYSSAGHEQPIWYHAETEKVEKLEAVGYPLGLFKSFPYETREIELQQGDRIVLYTDGVTDACNENNDRFGHEALLDLVSRSGSLTADELTQAIIDAVEDFTEGKKQKDDIIVAVLELQADSWVHKSIKFSQSTDFISEILEALSYYDLDTSTIYAIRLAIDETFANAWRHGCDQKNDIEFEISYHISDEGFRLRVKDTGVGFDHESLPDPTVKENLFRSHGRGVFLIRQMMNEVEFNNTGNEISIFKQFNPIYQDNDSSYDNLLLNHITDLKKQQESLEQAKTADGDTTDEPADAVIVKFSKKIK